MTIATSENLHVLLQVQEKDSQILAANHEIKELPERKEIEATQRKMQELDQALKAKESEVHENNKTQKRLEDEVATVEERIENQKRKLYGGEVIAIKELQALEKDIESLKERQIAIEDQIIDYKLQYVNEVFRIPCDHNWNKCHHSHCLWTQAGTI